ncbi:S24 family peptidase [Clostridium sp.]|uniref:LexA family protein n=1 Tax=Clostridium sp. TaxID=1506 RepID=UPI0025C21B59|nr:S24 family peptidase [Clostridium sp.]
MNDSIEDNYYLSKEWIRKTKDVFILKVKGDSMINKNIYNGDYVVISKQNTPSIRDIVAVDIKGEATLKTYKTINGKIVLMPENEKYEPIIIEDQLFIFLGVAIGLIKNPQN